MAVRSYGRLKGVALLPFPRPAAPSALICAVRAWRARASSCSWRSARVTVASTAAAAPRKRGRPEGGDPTSGASVMKASSPSIAGLDMAGALALLVWCMNRETEWARGRDNVSEPRFSVGITTRTPTAQDGASPSCKSQRHIGALGIVGAKQSVRSGESGFGAKVGFDASRVAAVNGSRPCVCVTASERSDP